MCIGIYHTNERTNEEFKYNFFVLLSWKVGVEVNYHWKRIRRFRIWRTPHVHLWHLPSFVMSLSQLRAGFLPGLLQLGQSVIMAPFILLLFLAGSISVLLHLRFPFYISFLLHFRLRFTFVAAPLEFSSDSVHFVTFPLQFPNSVSVLLQLH